MKYLLLSLLLLVVPGLALAAPPEPISVALVATGSLDDNSWNSLAQDAMVAISSRYGARILYRTGLSRSQYETAIAEAAGRCPLVFCHGYEFGAATMKVAPKFPKTTFVITAGDPVKHSAANVIPLGVSYAETGYLAGWLAARLRPGNIGCVGGEETPDLTGQFAACAAGLKSVSANSRVETRFVGSWTDYLGGEKAVQDLQQAGCSTILINADTTGRGAYAAARQNHLAMLLSNAEAEDLDGTDAICSAVPEFVEVFSQIYQQVNSRGPLPRGPQVMNMRNNRVALILNGNLKLSDSDQQAFSDLSRRLQLGELLADGSTPPFEGQGFWTLQQSKGQRQLRLLADGSAIEVRGRSVTTGVWDFAQGALTIRWPGGRVDTISGSGNEFNWSNGKAQGKAVRK